VEIFILCEEEWRRLVSNAVYLELRLEIYAARIHSVLSKDLYMNHSGADKSQPASCARPSSFQLVSLGRPCLALTRNLALTETERYCTVWVGNSLPRAV